MNPESAIRSALPDRSVAFVFPTQASADAWARKAARMPGVGAVETDRFLGWDRLKAILTAPSIPPGRAEATGAHRLLWAHGRTMEADGESGGGQAFAAFHARIAPSLQALAAAAGPAGMAGKRSAEDAPAGPPGLRGYLALLADYRAFLDRNNLYEPAFLRAAPPRSTGGGSGSDPGPVPGTGPGGRVRRYLVLGADLLHDFAHVAEAAGDAVRAVPLSTPSPESARLALFSDARKEYAWVFSECARLIDEGFAPSDIAISATEPQGVAAAHLDAAAAEAGVPVSLRQALPLARTPFGTLLRLIQEAGLAGCALGPLSSLLRCRSFPWKAGIPEKSGALLRFGARYRVLEQTGSLRSGDIWEATFARCPHDPGIRAYYRSISRAVAAICEARRFETLRAAIHAFRDGFLDESTLPESAQRTTQRIMEELENLDRAWRSTARPGRKSDLPALRLLGASLAASRYVEQGAPGAVPIYPYGAAPLHPARRQFVLDASHSGLRVPSSPFEFLGDEEIEFAESEAGNTDPSALTAAAHAACGSTVFCHAAEGVSGWTVPHPCFAGWGIEGERQDAAALAAIASSPPKRELEAWEGTCGPAPDGSRVHAALPILLREAGILATSHPSSAAWRAEEAAGPEGIGAARAFLSAAGSDGLIHISPSSLADISACPFRWFASRTPGAKEEIAPWELFPDTVAGEVAHSAIRRLFAGIAESGPFDPARLPEYGRLVPGAVEFAYEALARRSGPLPALAGDGWKRLLEDRLARLLADETWMEGWEAGEFEKELAMPVPGGELSFGGRADRIAHRDGRYAIVDYKKGKVPSKGELGLDPEGGLGNFQITAYAMMCESSGMDVERACFWSVEKAKRLIAFGPGGIRATAADYGPERRAVEVLLEKAAESLRDGRFLVPDRDRGRCAGCGWKGACRATFASEGKTWRTFTSKA